MAAKLDDLMRDRFKEALAEIEAIEAVSIPLRAERDDVRRQMAPFEAKERDLNNQIRQAESGLFDLKNEIGSIVRALRGKTSSPGEEPAIAQETASVEQASDAGVSDGRL